MSKPTEVVRLTDRTAAGYAALERGAWQEAREGFEARFVASDHEGGAR